MHVLETLALKKTADEIIFTQIRAEFENRRVAEGLSSATASGAEDYSFTIGQMRSKFKWFKKTWKELCPTIRSGSDLSAKVTDTPD